MNKKEKLEKLLDLVDELMKQEGNEWMIESLLKRLNLNIKTEADLGKINAIYEYCIEEIVKKQANEFYDDFPIDEIKNILINDFIRMERFKRQDNFEDFCLALYQQIECITNIIFQNTKMKDIIQKLLPYPAFVNSKTKERNLGSFLVADLIFGKKNAKGKCSLEFEKYYALDKIYLIMYFICYKAEPENSDYNVFFNNKNLVFEIYQYRNKNHRGEPSPKDEITAIFSKIDPRRAFYYLKFSTFLIFFVEGIKNGYSNIHEFYIKYKDLEYREYHEK